MKPSHPINKLLTRLDYQFKNIALLDDALTHRSASARNNERMEFLGDSVLNFVIAEELFIKYPQYPEGDLSRLRASLVNKDGLALIAQDLQLGDFLRLGSGELKSGGYRRHSILADAVEAIFGAVLIDSDFESCKQLILRLYQKQLSNVTDPAMLKDPKTRLQELLQSRKLALPVYEITQVKGKAHQQDFSVQCSIDELNIATYSHAGSRRKAEQIAAEEAITQVQKQLQKVKK